MDHYDIDMQGTLLIERIAVPAWGAGDEGRILYDTGGNEPYVGDDSDFQRIWNEGNMGPGSGLDADTLDGRNASYFDNRIDTVASDATSIVPVGTILTFAGTAAPTGYMRCDGSPLSIAVYAELFAVIGVTWGNPGGGDFNVPDMEGRFLRMQDNGTGRDPDAAGRVVSKAGGATGDNVGSYQDDEYAAHTHTESGHAGGGLGYEPGPNTLPSAQNTGSSGGSIETRPKNVYVTYIIKYE